MRKTGLDRCATAIPTGIIARTIAAARHSHAAARAPGSVAEERGLLMPMLKMGPRLSASVAEEKPHPDGADRDRVLAAQPGPQ
jgi:hypothetical protein